MLLAFIIILVLLIINYVLYNQNDNLKDENLKNKTIIEHLKVSNNEFAEMLAEYDPSLKQYLDKENK